MNFEYTTDPDPVATGGQGAVYFGQRSDGRPVAIKVAAPGKQAERALHKEIELLLHMRDAGVSGVMPILDSGERDGRVTMVMPRYPRHLGDWLRDTILEPGPNTLREVFLVVGRLSSTLSSIHHVYYDGGTVVHRDIKPENVYLDAKNRLFIGDFGGAMAVEELRAVELAMFGTPMWAPLDQLLPGRTIPDTTWDTYATAVILYAAITGARPAYQANPHELLTPAGQALWEAARDAVEASDSQRFEAQKRFAMMRRGSTAADLIDVTGRAALVSGDREALSAGISKLGGLAGVDPSQLRKLERGLWNLLVRALSPLSHPSPPNRYRDAAELADELEDLSSLLGRPAPPPSTRPRPTADPSLTLVGAGISAEDSTHRTTLSDGPPVAAIAGGLVLLVAVALGLYFAWPTLMLAFNATKPLPEHVEVPGGTLKLDEGTVAVKPFAIDTTEVDVENWAACIEAKRCPKRDLPSDPTLPAAPLSFDEARALCEYRGGAIPSEAQWRLAHGPKPFPWGDTSPKCDEAVALGCADTLQPVGSARQGASPFGAVDMAGNAWEWVRGADGTPVVMGGGMTSTPKELGIRGRKPVPPETPATLGGVRCAYPR